MFYFVFAFDFCFCCLFVFFLLLLLLLLLLFLNEYVTMNFSERPGINALKTTLTMLVKEHRKYHF